MDPSVSLQYQFLLSSWRKRIAFDFMTVDSFLFQGQLSLLITCFLLCWSFAPCGSQMSIRIVDIYLIILFILLLRSLFILLLVSLAPTPHISVFEICVSLSLSPLPSLSPSLPPSFPLSHTYTLSLFLCISLFNQCNLITPGQVKLNHFCFQAESIVLWMNAVLGSLEFFFFFSVNTHVMCGEFWLARAILCEESMCILEPLSQQTKDLYKCPNEWMDTWRVYQKVKGYLIASRWNFPDIYAAIQKVLSQGHILEIMQPIGALNSILCWGIIWKSSELHMGKYRRSNKSFNI